MSAKKFHKGTARVLNYLCKSSKDTYLSPTSARVSIIRTDLESGDPIILRDAVAGVSGHYVYFMINSTNITNTPGQYKVRFTVVINNEIFKFFVDIEILADEVQDELDAFPAP